MHSDSSTRRRFPSLHIDRELLRVRIRELEAKVEQQREELLELRARVVELDSAVRRLSREREPQGLPPQQQRGLPPHEVGPRRPPTPPPWATSQQQPWLDQLRRSAVPRGERQLLDGGEVLVLSLRGSVVPCVVCYGNPTQGLFSWSWSLLGTVFGDHYPFERCVEDEEVYRELRRRNISLPADSSACRGFLGYGASGCSQGRQRAARLALAATAAAWRGSPYPDPTWDGAFPQLVRQVASLLSSPTRWSSDHGTDEWSLIGGDSGGEDVEAFPPTRATSASRRTPGPVVDGRDPGASLSSLMAERRAVLDRGSGAQRRAGPPASWS